LSTSQCPDRDCQKTNLALNCIDTLQPRLDKFENGKSECWSESYADKVRKRRTETDNNLSNHQDPETKTLIKDIHQEIMNFR